jgi:3-oxoacyl-[acyl-carrier-protein] synthase-3
MAKAFVESGIYQTVLVVSSEKFSSIVNYQDRNTCVLFGDGASASVVRNAGPGFKLGPIHLNSDGRGAQSLKVPAGGCREPATEETVQNGRHFVEMNGREIFKHAVREMEASSVAVLEKVDLGVEDLRWLVPHQANIRIIDSVSKRLNVPDEKVFKECVRRYGNNSAASVAIALDELTQKHEIAVGEHIMLTAFGAGLTYGAILLTKIDGEDAG